MTVTALKPAEAPPRRLSLQEWLSTQRNIDFTSPTTDAHRTWLELVGAHAFAAAKAAFEYEMRGAIDLVIRDGHLPVGGFLATTESLRDKAIQAAFASGCADVLAGEVGRS